MMGKTFAAVFFARRVARRTRRLVHIASVFVATLISAQSGLFAAQVYAWGNTVGMLRLGTSVVVKPSDSSLGVALENVGLKPLDVVIGTESGYFFSFRATDTKGVEHLIALNTQLNLSEAIGEPYVIHILPRGSHEITFPLTQLIEIVKDGNISLDVLLRRSYKVRVLYGLRMREQRATNLMHAYPNLWTGPMRPRDGENKLIDVHVSSGIASLTDQ